MKIIQSLKAWFKTKTTKSYNVSQQVSFKDLAGKEIFLEIQINGNNTIVLLHNKESSCSFRLDTETATLLSFLLQSYSTHGTFPNLNEENE